MRHFAKSNARRDPTPVIKPVVSNSLLPKINMVFFGTINWTFEKILAEYTSRLKEKYNIIPSRIPISGCDIYQYWRPAHVTAQKLFSKISPTHEYFTKGIHMIHDSPYDIKRHNTNFRLNHISKFNSVLCTSREQYDFYGTKVGYESLHHIPLGVFEDKVIHKAEINREKKIKIGFVARLYPDKVKGEDLLVQIAEKLDPRLFEFVIHSPSAPGLISQLKSLKFSVNTQGEFDVLLICSKYEGTPLPLIECCASGIYVLSTRVGEAKWLLPESQLCSNEPTEFVEKLNYISSNKEILEESLTEMPNLVKNRKWDNHVKGAEHLWYKIMNPSDLIEVEEENSDGESDSSIEISDCKDPENIENPMKRRVFIIGGAPTVNDVDLSLLKNEDVMCVNKSIELFDNPKYFVTMDYTFFKKIDDPELNIISKAQNSYFILNNTRKVFRKLQNGNILDYTRNVEYKNLSKFNNIIESTEITPFGSSIKAFAHGENSGFCAIQLALLLGYEEINLIGFDSQVYKNQATHYHDGYSGLTTFLRMASKYQNNFDIALKGLNSVDRSKIRTITPSSFFEKYIKKITLEEALPMNVMQNNLVIVGYYTKNTPYEEEAKKLIESLDKLNLNHDIKGVKSLGSWQSNTRYKVKFLKKMLKKHKGSNLLYVDVDAIVHEQPALFTDSFDYDIAVRWQDFRWRKNECLSGTIYLANNEKTIELCNRWEKLNESESESTKTYEQWNLGKVIVEMREEGKIRDANLPPEYTMIFDSMRSMYPNVKPVIEHFQASRKNNEQRKK